jgi:hypothetical protein
MAKVGGRKGLQCVGITEKQIKQAVQAGFPNLKAAKFKVTSCPDTKYNCIAWAAGDTKNFWWPTGGYWPDGVPRELTLDAFTRAFATQGYTPCDDVRYEEGFEKIAIYAEDGKPTHAARQIGPQKWTSKLGRFADISHPLTGVEGTEYGRKVIVMRRPKS